MGKGGISDLESEVDITAVAVGVPKENLPALVDAAIRGTGPIRFRFISVHSRGTAEAKRKFWGTRNPTSTKVRPKGSENKGRSECSIQMVGRRRLGVAVAGEPITVRAPSSLDCVVHEDRSYVPVREGSQQSWGVLERGADDGREDAERIGRKMRVKQAITS